MAATYRASGNGGSSSGAANRTVTVTTAIADDLLVVFVVLSGNTSSTVTMTDDHADGLGTYTRVGNALWSSSANNSVAFVRDAKLGSTDTSFVITCTSGSNTCGILGWVAVQGMSKAGSAAIRSSGSQANQAVGSTPAPTLDQSALTGNMTLTAVMSQDSSVTEASGWTERIETLLSSPTTVLEVCTRDSGFTGTTITYGSTVQSAYASWALELDGSAAEPPVVEGTAALVAGGAEFAASGSVAGPVVEATAALTAGGAEFAATASAFIGWTATAALTGPGAELTASGTTTSPHPVGTLSRSVMGLARRPAGDFSGKPETPPFFEATASLTGPAAEFAATGPFYNPRTGLGTLSRSVMGLAVRPAGNFAGKDIGTFAATAALVAGGAEFAASATFTVPVYTATAALTAGGAELAAAATFAPPVSTATAPLTAGAALFTASATVTPPARTATAPLVAGGAEFAATAHFGVTTTATAALTGPGAEFAATALFATSAHVATAALEGPPGTFAAAATFAGASDLLDALGAYYRLDGNLLDSSGEDQHLSGTVTYDVGKLNSGLTDGLATRDPWIQFTAPPMSFAFWVKPSGGDITLHFNVGLDTFGLGISSFGAVSRLSGFPVPIAALDLDVFSHIVYTVDALGNDELFVDGSSVHTGFATPPAAFALLHLEITAGTAIVDEVGIWGKVLNAAEIEDLYNGGDGFDPTPPTPTINRVVFTGTVVTRRVFEGTVKLRHVFEEV